MIGHECASHFSAGNCLLAEFCAFFKSIILPSELPKSPIDPACERVSYSVENSPSSWLSPQDRSLFQILCLSFHHYLFFCHISKRLVCLSGYLGSSASIQKLFCGSCFTWRWSFDVFVREKVISPSYSFDILAPPLVCVFNVTLYEQFIYVGY